MSRTGERCVLVKRCGNAQQARRKPQMVSLGQIVPMVQIQAQRDRSTLLTPCCRPQPVKRLARAPTLHGPVSLTTQLEIASDHVHPLNPQNHYIRRQHGKARKT